MNITYYGHSCFLLDDGTSKLLFDPFLTGNDNAAIKADEVSCDYIFVSHGHADHFGDAVDISKRTGAPIIAGYELAMHCGEKGCAVEPMGIGGQITFPFGSVKMLTALHSAGGEPETGNTGYQYLGNPNGFLVEFAGKTIYFAGDTGLTSEMKLWGELHNIDLSFLPIGDRFTMGPSDAAIAAQFLNTKAVIPMHYNTWEPIAQDPDSFFSQLKAGETPLPIKVGECIPFA